MFFAGSRVFESAVLCSCSLDVYKAWCCLVACVCSYYPWWDSVTVFIGGLYLFVGFIKAFSHLKKQKKIFCVLDFKLFVNNFVFKKIIKTKERKMKFYQTTYFIIYIVEGHKF
jgi:hypothetical protein